MLNSYQCISQTLLAAVFQFPITALREIKILQLLKHENVVNLIEICRTKGWCPVYDLAITINFCLHLGLYGFIFRFRQPTCGLFLITFYMHECTYNQHAFCLPCINVINVSLSSLIGAWNMHYVVLTWLGMFSLFCFSLITSSYSVQQIQRQHLPGV